MEKMGDWFDPEEKMPALGPQHLSERAKGSAPQGGATSVYFPALGRSSVVGSPLGESGHVYTYLIMPVNFSHLIVFKALS